MNAKISTSLIEIAEQQIFSLKNVNGDPVSSFCKQCEYAAVAIILSACAIESHINLLLYLPLLYLKPPNNRRYYSRISKNYIRTNIHEKIDLLTTFIDIPNNLKKEVDKLIKYRNEIIHATPIHEEQQDNPNLENNNEQKSDIESSIMMSSYMNNKYIQDAEACYLAALKLIELLDKNLLINEINK